jgi:hypothetical protein
MISNFFSTCTEAIHCCQVSLAMPSVVMLRPHQRAHRHVVVAARHRLPAAGQQHDQSILALDAGGDVGKGRGDLVHGHIRLQPLDDLGLLVATGLRRGFQIAGERFHVTDRQL